MRVLVLGAGGTGGYFGGRLAQSGADVAFLVRPARAAQLARDGLRIRSALGDADLPVRVVTAQALPGVLRDERFDLVVLSCKAWDLEAAIADVAPAVDAGATVMPILNGLLHYAALDARFGRERVLGGLCFISVAKAADGSIVHMGRPASITFGERDGGRSARVDAFAALCARAGLDHRASDDIATEQWIKFSFLATLAAGTCLMRDGVGAIVACEGGAAFMAALHDECLAVAAAEGHRVPEKARAIARDSLVDPASQVKASMLRDLEAGGPVEAAHIVGDMWHRARAAGLDTPLLQAAWVHLQAYQARRQH
ncbi:2-dehydropantoate 2-reductase [Luteimonas wenzhouensis]|uniref:2-dehydropantoate 2-reductase n=1 Tax=Luteimonas wenzhouensis TaxID=2599615 RepID=A0A5C5TVS9_9GAMM|nr:2-dehydropantoate 2-reductase [Luteimonas wenzhouensis]TWT18301.1 2-dehydropantoate 2-reductase [Luteimonas wenzhouensis]